MNHDPAHFKEDVPMSRHLLESLSTGELLELTNVLGIDIPPETERILIIEEILESYFENNNEDEMVSETTPVFTETVALPKQYNISFVEVKIRDPLLVFVFWEIKGHDKELHEKADNFNGYCLRVIPLNDGGNWRLASNGFSSNDDTKTKGDSFTVAINVNDQARYIGFPEHTSKTADSFIIKLCAIRSDKEMQIAVSQPFNLPRLAEFEKLCGMNPLIELSGARDFLTIKSTDRHCNCRGKRQ
ncbi:MAG: DUF4912 domain-containing protein [Treponema sp.]|jgi:hypothetical protein|nr:DUF4912 domain-containing protein [Treponema sp.]